MIGSRLVARMCRFGQAATQLFDGIAGGLEQVFAVVDDDEPPLAAYPGGEVIDDVVGVGVETDARRHGERHGVSGVDHSEIDEPAPVGNCHRSEAAVCNARRVLPVPPTPISVTIRF